VPVEDALRRKDEPALALADYDAGSITVLDGGMLSDGAQANARHANKAEQHGLLYFGNGTIID
jgi:hypothetical protein